MADIKIRNLDPVVVAKIDELAKKKKISREEYVRRYLASLAVLEDVLCTENKYGNLVNAVVDRLDQANDVIEINNMLLEKVYHLLEER